MKRDIKLEIFYDEPIEKVWKALTDSDELAKWLMKNDFKPEVGHRFQFRAKPQPGWNGIVDCEVLEIVPLKSVVYTWSGGENEEKTLNTTVHWTLEAMQSGTKVYLEHKGFAGMKGILTSFILESGWKKMKKEKFLEVVRKIHL